MSRFIWLSRLQVTTTTYQNRPLTLLLLSSFTKNPNLVSGLNKVKNTMFLGAPPLLLPTHIRSTSHRKPTLPPFNCDSKMRRATTNLIALVGRRSVERVVTKEG